jgi:hypothetical protein
VVGVLMAADPAGSVLGAWLITRVVPARLRPKLVGMCAVAGALVAGVLAWRWWRAAASIRGVGSGGAPISSGG